jgi:hypothetical protein
LSDRTKLCRALELPREPFRFVLIWFFILINPNSTEFKIQTADDVRAAITAVERLWCTS